MFNINKSLNKMLGKKIKKDKKSKCMSDNNTENMLMRPEEDINNKI